MERLFFFGKNRWVASLHGLSFGVLGLSHAQAPKKGVEETGIDFVIRSQSRRATGPLASLSLLDTAMCPFLTWPDEVMSGNGQVSKNEQFENLGHSQPQLERFFWVQKYG